MEASAAAAGDPATGVGTGFASPPAFSERQRTMHSRGSPKIVLLKHDVMPRDPYPRFDFYFLFSVKRQFALYFLILAELKIWSRGKSMRASRDRGVGLMVG